jgi:dephospho-CoA kinase
MVRKILAAQTTREARRNVADDILLNDGSLAELRSRVQALHRLYVGLAAEKFPQDSL